MKTQEKTAKLSLKTRLCEQNLHTKFRNKTPDTQKPEILRIYNISVMRKAVANTYIKPPK